MVLRDATDVARRTLDIADVSAPKVPVLVNGAAGVVVTFNDQPVAVMGFTVSDRKIAEIDVILDPDRIGQDDMPFVGR